MPDHLVTNIYMPLSHDYTATRRAFHFVGDAATATFEAYIPIALGYLALTIPISLAAAHLERRFRYDT